MEPEKHITDEKTEICKSSYFGPIRSKTPVVPEAKLGLSTVCRPRRGTDFCRKIHCITA